jgi:hypothetical protein
MAIMRVRLSRGRNERGVLHPPRPAMFCWCRMHGLKGRVAVLPLLPVLLPLVVSACELSPGTTHRFVSTRLTPSSKSLTALPAGLPGDGW